jgi:hypothetical protein
MIKPPTINNLMTVRHLSSIENLGSLNKKYNIIQYRNRLKIHDDNQFKNLEYVINNQNNAVIFKHDSEGNLKKCFWTQNSNKAIRNIRKSDTDVLKQLFRYNLQSTKDSNLTINFLGNEGGTVGTILSTLTTNPDSKFIWINDKSGIGTFCNSSIPIVSGLAKSSLEPNFLEWLKDKPKLNLSNLIYIGVSNPNPLDSSIIEKHNITHIKPDSINYRELADKIYGCNVHISFDANILYPINDDFEPITRKGGLSSNQIHTLISIINCVSNISKIDIIEVNPFSLESRLINEYKNIVLGTKRHSINDSDFIHRNYDDFCSKVIINEVLAPTFGYIY